MRKTKEKNTTKDFNIDFIGIGAPRCGTTWISACLAEHPEIAFSKDKEVHFFDHSDRYHNDLAQYETFFDGQDGQVKGEFTPTYFLHEDIAPKVQYFFPDIKLLVVLRNPVERAFSNYQYRKSRFGNIGTFESYLEKEDDPIIKSGWYGFYLEKWFRHFEPENVHVIIHEEAIKNPERTFEDLYSFLGVDESFVPPSIERPVNTSVDIQYKIPKINLLIQWRKKLWHSSYGRKTLNFLKVLGVNTFVQKVIRWNAVPEEKKDKTTEKMSDCASEYLNQLYRHDIQKLEQLLGRRLTVWR